MEVVGLGRCGEWGRRCRSLRSSDSGGCRMAAGRRWSGVVGWERDSTQLVHGRWRRGGLSIVDVARRLQAWNWRRWLERCGATGERSVRCSSVASDGSGLQDHRRGFRNRRQGFNVIGEIVSRSAQINQKRY